MEHTLRCEQCGREAGPDMLACPKREAGNCPYQLEFVSGSRRACLLGTGLMTSVTAGLVLLGLSAGGTLYAFIFAGIFGAMALLGVYSLMSGPSPMLINKQTGTSWIRTRMLGRTYDQITLPPEPLDLGLAFEHVPAHPPSIAAWQPETSPELLAPRLFRWALLGLIARGRLAVRRGRQITSGMPRLLSSDPGGYLLARGPRADEPVSGALEQRVLDAVRAWQAQSLDDPYVLKLISIGWYLPPLHGISISETVKQTYGDDKADPFAWLVELVAQDAAAQGVDPRAAGQLATVREQVQALEDDLARENGDLARVLFARVEQAISLRVSSS
jgi:hypothetical protein